MKPNIRHHTKQKNYIAIIYSLVFHLFLFIFIVNYSSVSIDNIIENLKREFTISGDKIYNSQYPDINEMDINELYIPHTRSTL